MPFPTSLAGLNAMDPGLGSTLAWLGLVRFGVSVSWGAQVSGNPLDSHVLATASLQFWLEIFAVHAYFKADFATQKDAVIRFLPPSSSGRADCPLMRRVTSLPPYLSSFSLPCCQAIQIENRLEPSFLHHGTQFVMLPEQRRSEFLFDTTTKNGAHIH